MLGHTAHQQVHERAKAFGIAIGHGFRCRVGFAGAAFDHVGRQRPGRAGKTDECRAGRQSSADLRNRRVSWRKAGGQFTAAEPLFHAFETRQSPQNRSFTSAEGQILAQGARNGQDVGKQDGAIKVIAPNGLQCDFGCRVRVVAKIEKRPDLRPQATVLRQIASGLAHEPRGPGPLGLTPQGGEQGLGLRMLYYHGQ